MPLSLLLLPYEQPITPEKAKENRKYGRDALLGILNTYHAHIVTFKEKPENQKHNWMIVAFNTLSDAIAEHMHKVNECSVTTSEMRTYIQKEYEFLVQTKDYPELKDILNNVLLAIDADTKMAKNRERIDAKNEYRDLWFDALYLATFPAMAIAAGIVVCCVSNPIGLLVIGIAAAIGLISQALYFYAKKSRIDELDTKINNDYFNLDMAKGKAMEDRFLPKKPATKVVAQNPNPKVLQQLPSTTQAAQLLEEVADLAIDAQYEVMKAAEKTAEVASSYWSFFTTNVSSIATAAMSTLVVDPPADDNSRNSVLYNAILY